MSKHSIAWACLLGTILILLCSCGSTPPGPAPQLFLPAQFQWHQEGQQQRIAIPTTSIIPGPTTPQMVNHQQGLGLVLSASSGPDLFQTVIQQSQQVMAAEISQLKKNGWHQLFQPTTTGSFPDYVLYVTFSSGPHYCFAEYGATILNQTEASQQLDLYYN